MDDGQIVRLYTERSENAIDETYKKYRSLCMTVANNILDSREDSEECVNDAVLAVWNTIPPKRPDSLKAYICKVVRNIAAAKLRYNKRLKRSDEFTVSLSELEEVLPDHRVNRSDSDIAAVIETFLRKQRPLTRKIFVQKYCLCYTQKEIAELYSISIGKVNSILSRVRKKLREHLIKEGIEI